MNKGNAFEDFYLGMLSAEQHLLFLSNEEFHAISFISIRSFWKIKFCQAWFYRWENPFDLPVNVIEEKETKSNRIVVGFSHCRETLKIIQSIYLKSSLATTEKGTTYLGNR